MLGLYDHVACWPCELYLECGEHICSVIFVKYVYSAPCCMVDVNDFMCGFLFVHTSPYVDVKYFAYMANILFAQFSGHICSWHMFGIDM